MSAAVEPGPLGPRISLFEHALRLHQQQPDSPLPRNGEPFPDDERYRGRRHRQSPDDPRRIGADVAAVLDAHFATPDATAAHLHEAIVATDVDDDLIDHTGRLLRMMAGCAGMGTTLAHYPPAPIVLAAHAGLLARQTPTASRYYDAALIADYLAGRPPEQHGCTTEQRDHLVRRYLTVLNRPDWCDAARGDLDSGTTFSAWFIEGPATRRRLRAFTDVPGDR